MRLTHRLKRLESHQRSTGVCPRCQGKGWPHYFVQGPADFELTTKPGERVGCDHCGRVGRTQLIVLDPDAPNPLEMWLASAANGANGRAPTHS